MILIIVTLAIVYALGALAVARCVALSALDNHHYPPYSIDDYATVGWLGLAVGVIWPLLAVIIGGSAVAGWLVTRK